MGKHIYIIDVLRFTAAVMVAVFHLTWRTQGYWNVLPFGWVGVEIFFVISGIVIAGSVSGTTALHFARNRFLRLYPAAWICGALSCFVLFALPAAAWAVPMLDVRISAQAITWSAFLVKGPFLASAYWTLPIELSFYLLVMVFCVWLSINKRLLALVLVLWSACYNLPFFLSLTHLWRFQVFDLRYGPANMSLLRYGVFFGLGLLLFLFRTEAHSKTDLLLFALTLGVGCLEICCRATQLSETYLQGRLSATALTLEATAAFIASICLIQLLGSKDALPMLKKPLRAIGLATYPMYLLHETIGGGLTYLLQRLGISTPAAIGLAITGVTTISIYIALVLEPRLRANLVRMIQPFISLMLAGSVQSQSAHPEMAVSISKTAIGPEKSLPRS